ncbi:MAG: DUF3467 domain-containing protein [Actinomycetota bacterium]
MANGPEVPVQIRWPEDALWPQGGYANVILVNHTPWDFTLRFGQVTLPSLPPDDPAAAASVEIVASPIAQVTLPPVALAQLSAILQEQIVKYTNTYGAIGGSPEKGLS